MCKYKIFNEHPGSLLPTTVDEKACFSYIAKSGLCTVKLTQVYLLASFQAIPPVRPTTLAGWVGLAVGWKAAPGRR